MKPVRITYHGSSIELSVSDGTSPDDVLDVLKRWFDLTCRLDQMEFCDRLGNPLTWPATIPNNFSLYLRVSNEVLTPIAR
jgi:hypothetical protein